MAIIPCTQCPDCGLWNQCTVQQCECGADLRNRKVVMTDVANLSALEYGDIQKNPAIYGQICPKCGKVAFTSSPRKRKMNCPSCGADAISNFRPVYYLDLPE